MPNNDDYGFWESDRDWSPEGSSPRPRRAPRTVAPTRAHQSGTRPAQPNLLLRRVGALGAACLLALTVALVVRGTGNTDQISTAAAAGDTPLEPVAVVPLAGDVITAPVTAAPVTAAAAPATAPVAAPVETAPATAAPVETAPATTAATARTASAEAAGSQTRPAAVATPVVETKRTCAIDYKVRAGDYWISIAQRSSVKLADLLTANGAKVTTALYPGRTICLPANATTPTTAKPTPTTAKPTSTTAKPTVTTTKPKPTANTAAPTTAAPSTTVAPPRINYSRAEVEQIIRNVWPDDLEDEAVRIATRESNLIPTARNSCCYGLFQIYFTANKASLTSWGITSAAALFDPQVNAYAAYAMYLRAGGWSPWRL